MTSKKEQLAFLRTVAECAEDAANNSSKNRELDALRECIRQNEREHRAFGRRLVGDIGARMSVDQAVDYFVAKVLQWGATKYKCGQAKIEELDGIREDYIRGAILMSNGPFAGGFLARLAGAFPRLSERAIFQRIEELDYAALVASGNIKKAG